MSGYDTSIVNTGCTSRQKHLAHLDEIVALLTSNHLSFPHTLKHLLMRRLSPASKTMRFRETAVSFDNEVFW